MQLTHTGTNDRVLRIVRARGKCMMFGQTTQVRAAPAIGLAIPPSSIDIYGKYVAETPSCQENCATDQRRAEFLLATVGLQGAPMISSITVRGEFYSYRKATIGSMRSARKAGPSVATNATVPSTATT